MVFGYSNDAFIYQGDRKEVNYLQHIKKAICIQYNLRGIIWHLQRLIHRNTTESFTNIHKMKHIDEMALD